MLTRRKFVASLAATGLSGCATAPEAPLQALRLDAFEAPPAAPPPPMPARYGAIYDEPFPIPAVPAGVVPERLWRQMVENPYPGETPDTIVVAPSEGLLHLILQDGMAWRYGVGVGAAGRAWEGTARMQFKREWPRWKVPQSMIERQPELEPYSVANGGMDPGPGNPLGARALYLFQNGVDTLYRIHGACEPEYLGQAVSSGCIRMLDQDAIDLHDRVTHGATVIVLPSNDTVEMGPLY